MKKDMFKGRKGHENEVKENFGVQGDWRHQTNYFYHFRWWNRIL